MTIWLVYNYEILLVFINTYAQIVQQLHIEYNQVHDTLILYKVYQRAIKILNNTGWPRVIAARIMQIQMSYVIEKYKKYKEIII